MKKLDSKVFGECIHEIEAQLANMTFPEEKDRLNFIRRLFPDLTKNEAFVADDYSHLRKQMAKILVQEHFKGYSIVSPKQETLITIDSINYQKRKLRKAIKSQQKSNEQIIFNLAGDYTQSSVRNY